jgi:hypothetical protein
MTLERSPACEMCIQNMRERDFYVGERIFFVWNRGSAVCHSGSKESGVRKMYKQKQCSCGLCKQHKRGGAKRWKEKEKAQLLVSFLSTIPPGPLSPFFIGR